MEDEEEAGPSDGSPAQHPPPANMDISACPAFQYLDEMLSMGNISPTRAAKLKANYKLLSDTLKCSQDSEIQLLEEAKRSRAKLKRLRTELENTEEQSTSEEPESEVSELRRRLLQAYNELKAAEDRDYKTQHKLKCLQEEKRQLEEEIQTKPALIQKRETERKALDDKYEDLKKEVAQTQLEVRSLMENVEIHETQELEAQKELAEKEELIELKEAEKARLINIPYHISKETQRKRLEREDAMKKMETLNTEITEMEQQIKMVDKRNQSLRTVTEDMKKELEDVRVQEEASQMENRQLLEKQEVEKAELMGNRGILELKMKSLMSDKKNLNERRFVQLRENNRQMEALKRTEQEMTMASKGLAHVQSIYNKLQAQIDAAVPKREAAVKRRMELLNEVEALKTSVEKKLSVDKEEGQRRQQYGMIQELQRQSNRLREELHDLKCLRYIRAEERGQKHRELLRAQQLSKHIQQELREKDLIIRGHNRLSTMLQHRISQYSKLCDMNVKENERFVKLKHTASQTITELSEQIKVLEREKQRKPAIFYDRSLMEVSKSAKMRDKLRNDISEIAWKQDQISEECKDNNLEVMKLTETIKLQEEALLEINRNYETAIDRRNSLGIQLLEHEEILFKYYEKMNNQEAGITKGNMALETLEKEKSELQIEIQEEKRQIDLKKKELLLSRKLEEEITMLQIELSEERDKPSVNQRRALKGVDPSTADLVQKMEQLEVNLAERKTQLLEKELLVDQVTRLSKPLSEQAENCREDSLWMARKLNEVRADITKTNHRIMAVSAELSVKQAAALSQQQQIKDKELQKEKCQQRLEQGLAPSPEIEEECRKKLRDKKRRQRDREERLRLAEENEWRQLPNGKFTTAEVRPNAYIPHNNPLCVPVPYGAFAPFKPSQPAPTMRRFRSPARRPSEGQNTSSTQLHRGPLKFPPLDP
ncbi:coiled-coil domain-containing protein 146 [Cololabis saira]|uniref:coiled-coil domain-containing protein 146 n=1 Tax=Cololabis saira TaxID=129043 RepID=UPI002AD5AABC|nr:coiled-coil domain-containing protein 146 [Cololabis saira]